MTTGIDPNLFASLAKQYTGGIAAPVAGEAGYPVIANAAANNLEYVPALHLRPGSLVLETPALTTITAADTLTRIAGTFAVAPATDSDSWTLGPSGARVLWGGAFRALVLATCTASAKVTAAVQNIGLGIVSSGASPTAAPIVEGRTVAVTHPVALATTELLEVDVGGYVEGMILNGSAINDITVSALRLTLHVVGVA